VLFAIEDVYFDRVQLSMIVPHDTMKDGPLQNDKNFGETEYIEDR
jgi:hypothetical protein